MSANPNQLVTPPDDDDGDESTVIPVIPVDYQYHTDEGCVAKRKLIC